MGQGRIQCGSDVERSTILDRWLERIGQDQGAVWLPGTAGDAFRDPLRHVLRQNLSILLEEVLGESEEVNLEAAQTALHNIIRIRVVQSLTATQSVQFLLHLKPILCDVLPGCDLPALDSNIEQLTALAFDEDARCRERIAELRLNELRRMAFPGARRNESTRAGSGQSV